MRLRARAARSAGGRRGPSVRRVGDHRSRFGAELDQVALGLDTPASARLRELGRELPAVGALRALVLRIGALQRHRAGVVADPADLLEIGVAEQLLLRQCRELGPLGLDRARVLTKLL